VVSFIFLALSGLGCHLVPVCRRVCAQLWPGQLGWWTSDRQKILLWQRVI